MQVSEAIDHLCASLTERHPPETVAEIIWRAMKGSEAQHLHRQLRAVLASSLKRRHGWSSMPTRFHAPEPMDDQIDRARLLAHLFLGAQLPRSGEPKAIDAWIDAFETLIGKPVGESSFLHDRLNRAERAGLGLMLSRRRYSKLFRIAARLEDRLSRLRSEEAKRRLVLVSKAAFAADLTREHFGDHLPTAAFVAYYAARMKLRSEFTAGAQQRPFDELSAALLDWCEESAATRWWAVAHVFPRADVLSRIDESQRGQLLGRSFDVLQELADRLESAQVRSGIDLHTMVVRKGNDSSTWNTMAGAWNRARDYWIALVQALGMEDLFRILLPGKVMRLVAGDVAALHRRRGDGIHPDTLVWRDLPKPWLVVRGEADCNRAMIEATCARHEIDPERSGWSAPRPRIAVAPFRPTPELVHGVAIGNPYMAALLRRAGVFSGRTVRVSAISDLRGD